MRLIFDRNEAELAKKIEDDKSRFNNHLRTATPELADRLGKAYTAYNWVDPGILTAAVLSGNDNALQGIAEKVGADAWKMGVTPTDIRPSAKSPQQMQVEQQLARERFNKTFGLQKTVAPTSRTTPSKRRGFWGAAAHYTGLQAAADFVTPEAVENVIGDVSNFAYEHAKAGIQGFTAGMMMPQQLLVNELYSLANYLPSGHSFETQRNHSLFEQFVTGPLKETYFGQMLKQAISSDEKLTVGKGFFPSGSYVDAQEKAAAEYRPLVGSQKLPMTFGRTAGMALTDLGVLEEGSYPYSIISGLVDVGVAVKTDPTMGTGGRTRPFGTGGTAATAIESEAELVKAAAGLSAGQRPTVVPSIWNNWKNTAESVRTLSPFVSEKSPAAVWRSMRRQAILTADEIAKADTHEGVIAAIDKGVNTIDPAYEVRNLPAGRFSSVSNLGYSIKQSAQKYTRLFEVMPESTHIPMGHVDIAAKRLDDLMGVLGVDIAVRDQWINKLIDVHKDGTSQTFFNFLGDWEKEVLKAKLIERGIPEVNAKKLAVWKRESVDQVSKFTLSDLADGIPPAWVEGGGYGPLRLTQMLQDGAYVLDPTQLESVLKQIGNLHRLETAAGKLPGVIGATFRAESKMREGAISGLGWYQRELWKPAKVAAVRYLMRVLPDESARVVLSGTFEHPMSYVAAIADGRWAAKIGADGQFVTDAFGEIINKAMLGDQLDNEIASVLSLKKRIADLIKSGDDAGAALLQSTYADDLKNYDSLLARKQQVDDLLESAQGTLNDSLIGAGGNRARARILQDYQDGRYVKTNIYSPVSKAIPKEQKFWVTGIVQEVQDMFRNPHIRRIANGGLLDTDSLTIDGVVVTWAEHLKAGRTLNTDEAVAQWLYQGSGRKYFDAYFKNFSGVKAGYIWDSEENAREFVRVLNQEVHAVAGSNSEIRNAIATGMHDGKKAFSVDAQHVVTGSDEFTAFVKDVFMEDVSSPTHVRYNNMHYMHSNESTVPGLKQKNQLLNWFFTDVYGSASDKLARSATWRSAYWGRIEELGTLLDEDSAAKLLENLDKANLPRYQSDRIRKILSIANGDNSLEAADASARAFAGEYTRNLHFDASKQSLFGQQAKLFFPFFEAYREQLSVWTKLLVERPENAHKVDVAVRALREAEGIGPGDINDDGKKEGFFYRDPQTGEEVFSVFGSGWLGQIFSGVPFGNFKVQTKSLTMISSVLPGVGFTVQWPGQYMIPATKKWEPVSKLLFPYGRPEEQGNEALGGLINATLPLPTWFKRMTPFVADLATKLPVGGGTIGKLFSDAMNAFAQQPKENDVYRAYYLNTLRSLGTTRPVPQTTQEMEALLSDAEDATNKLYFLRGLGNFVLPGTPVSEFMAETKIGSVEMGVLADELRRYQNEAVDAGGQEEEGVTRFISVYGESVWPALGSIRSSKTFKGFDYSKEFDGWLTTNKKLVTTYPLVAGYFGPQNGEFDNQVYNRMVQNKYISPSDPADMIQQAESTVASSLYNTMKNKLTPAQQNSDEGKAVLSTFRESLQDHFPQWDIELAGAESKSRRKTQVKQLREIIATPSIAKTNTGKLVQSYMAVRDAEEKTFLTTGKKDWSKAKGSLIMRQKLSIMGDGYAQADPSFSRIWQSILSKEFDPPITEGQ